jgi:N-acetylmuramoyl-L-alanine amidase
VTIGRRTRGRGMARAAAVLAPAALCLSLAGCSTLGAEPSGAKTTGGGPVDAGVSAFTPAATPTIVAEGAYGKPSTGGVRLAPTASGLLDGKVIAIDPGHSGKYDTAMLYRTTIAYYGAGRRPCQNAGSTALDKKTTEADLTWDVASRVIPILRARGATVLLTRPDNEGYGPCNDERAQIANRGGANLLISIHADGNDVPTNRGFFVEYSEKMVGGDLVAKESKAAATTLVAAVASHSKLPIANYVSTGDGTIANSNTLGVLNTMQTGPAVLIEMGNIVQTPDWSILSTPEGLQAFAEGVAAGAGNIILTPTSDSASATPTPTPTKTK